MISHLGTVILKVSDMDRSVSFYRDLLGLPIKFESPGWTEFDLSGVALALHPCPTECLDDLGKNGVSVNFLVEDIKKVVTELRGRGAQGDLTIGEEEFGRFLEIADPDGYAVGIYQLRKR